MVPSDNLARRGKCARHAQFGIALLMLLTERATAVPVGGGFNPPRIPPETLAAAEHYYKQATSIPGAFPSNVSWSQSDDSNELFAEALYGTSPGEYTIELYPADIMAHLELRPEELDDPFVVGLIAGIAIHELGHVCFDQEGIPLTDRSGGTLASCEHLSIYSGSATASCELADELYDAACTSQKGNRQVDTLEVVRGLCETIKDAQNKYNNDDGRALAQSCVCGRPPFSPPAGCSHASNPKIPGGGNCASGFPPKSEVIPDCSVCSLVCGAR